MYWSVSSMLFSPISFYRLLLSLFSSLFQLRSPPILSRRIDSQVVNCDHGKRLSLLGSATWISALTLGIEVTGEEPVRFDAPRMVSADPLAWEKSGYQPSIAGTRLVSIRIRMSAQVPVRNHERIDELLFQVRSASGLTRVLDHWPKTQASSHVQGSIDVSSTNYEQQHFSLRALAGSPGTAAATGSLQRDAIETLERSYAEKPKLVTYLSSGTLSRGSGVFWQLRPSPEQSIEGDRDYWLLCEVSQDWKGDLFEVTAQASLNSAASSSSSSQMGEPGPSSRSAGNRRYMVAVYLAGDGQAYQHAVRFVEYEQRLFQVAGRHREQIRKTQTPTPLHRLAQSLDLSEPSIPTYWLDYVLYEPNLTYIDDKTAQLPVDVRVAVLDYIDNKQALIRLAAVR